ncbi:MAG TPA: HAMP domain-containing sensor histidine kinase [Kofleriaceae bacterium]|nr:HAMP domain-containing sensor histidine kinase [Kofleriaceae bacterium]
MKTPFRSLTSRMVALAAAQMIILAIAAVVIALAFMPDRPLPPPRDAIADRPPVRRPPRAAHLGPLLTLGCGFVVLAVGAALTARWIVRPVQQLSLTAREIGEGDLSARSGLSRTDEIGDLGRHIDDMAGQVARLLANERELLANVAHELRTPLARMGVALDLAGEGNAERARASLAEIATDVSELSTIVDDILTAMRLDAERGTALPLRRAATSPASIVHAAVGRLQTSHPRRPVYVTISSELPDVDVDPVLFRRALDNLVENAHKYTPDETQPITVCAGNSPNGIVFSVADRGIGIGPEDLPHVYEAFFRSERSRSRRTGGVGLGLTLARRIVEAHGGTISMDSEIGRGTRVSVCVPAVVT